VLAVWSEDLFLVVGTLGVDLPRLEFGASLKTGGGTPKHSNVNREAAPFLFLGEAAKATARTFVSQSALWEKPRQG
jgi:hypothetical protein